jgi:membrane fusion protein, multidrug efflux system
MLDGRKSTMLNWLLVFALLGACDVAAAPTTLAADRTEAKPTPLIHAARLVRKQRDRLAEITSVGRVEASSTVVVRTQITGQILKLNFTEGKVVHRGEILAQIDPRLFQAKLDLAVANRNRDQARLGNVTEHLHRDLPMLSAGFVTQDLVDDEKAEVAEDTAAVQADTAAVNEAQLELGYTRLTAPIDGVTGILKIDVGNTIRPTDTNGLVTVAQLQPISVIFPLPETDLPQVQRQMAKGPVTVLADSLVDGSKPVQGTLKLVDDQIIQRSGSVTLKAVFPNPSDHLWPGEAVNVRVLLNTMGNELVSGASEAKHGSQRFPKSTDMESTRLQTVSPRG